MRFGENNVLCSKYIDIYDNNFEQLKTYAETSLKTMKECYSEYGLKMN